MHFHVFAIFAESLKVFIGADHMRWAIFCLLISPNNVFIHLLLHTILRKSSLGAANLVRYKLFRHRLFHQADLIQLL